MTKILARRVARNRGGLPSVFSMEPFGDLREELDQMLTSWFADNDKGIPATFAPLLDLAETDTDYQVKADLPGIQPGEIKVQVLDNVLTISGERASEKTDRSTKDKHGTPTLHVTERYHGSFSRSIVLPGGVKQDQIDARYADGVLTVIMPKAEDQKPCQITVKT